MYTIGYRLLVNSVGKDAADKIAIKCEPQRKHLQLRIPVYNQKGGIQKFIEFVGDEVVARRLIKDFGSQRIRPKRFDYQAQKYIAKQAYNDLINVCGYTAEQAMCSLTCNNFEQCIIRCDNTQTGYQAQ